MRTTYDSEADAFYVRFSEARVIESEEVRPGVVFDFDEQGHLVAIELLDARRQLDVSVLVNSNAAE